MAAKEEAIEVIADDGVVTVDLPDDVAALGAETDPVVTKQPEPVTPAAKTAADEAAETLNKAIKRQEELRQAAEATAVAERRARENAERLAADRGREAQGYREQAESREVTILDNGISAAKMELTSAEQELERAMEAGEFKKASAAQVRIATAAARVERMEAEKVSIQAGTKKAPTYEGRVEAPPTGSPFEQYVSGYAPRAQAWLRAHPDCVPDAVPDGRGGMISLGGNSTKNSKMMAGHYAAKAQGLPEGSDDYFRVIEEHVGIREPVAASAPVSAAAEVTSARAVPKPAPRPAAPVSREPPAANGNGTTPSRVSLSPLQQETALYSYPANPGESEDAHRKRAFGIYAREYVKAKADGLIGRIGH